MIVKIVHKNGPLAKNDDDGAEERLAIEMVECEEIKVFDIPGGWQVDCLKYRELASSHKFNNSEGVKAYVMENGTTIDTLPRR